MSYYIPSFENIRQLNTNYDNDYSNKLYEGVICTDGTRFSRGIISQALYRSMKKADKMARTSYTPANYYDQGSGARYEIVMTHAEFDKFMDKLEEVAEERGATRVQINENDHYYKIGCDPYFAEYQACGFITNPEA